MQPETKNSLKFIFDDSHQTIQVFEEIQTDKPYHRLVWIFPQQSTVIRRNSPTSISLNCSGLSCLVTFVGEYEAEMLMRTFAMNGTHPATEVAVVQEEKEAAKKEPAQEKEKANPLEQTDARAPVSAPST